MTNLVFCFSAENQLFFFFFITVLLQFKVKLQMHDVARFYLDYYQVNYLSLLPLVLLHEIPAVVFGLTGSEYFWLC